MTKLIKHKNTGWGDDLATVKKHGGDIATTEKKVLARYLLELRKTFETNHKAKSIIVNSDPAISAKPQLLKLLSIEYQPDSMEIFEQAVEIILEELDEFRKKPSSLYLIDGETGMTIMPMTDELIYTPPDYVGEDGKLHKAKPILHPGVAASLTLAIYGKARIKRHLAKVKDDISKQAYKHLSNPEQIVEMAKERLAYLGVEVTSDPDRCNQTIEFGREQVEGIMQSPNIRFHRAHMFAAVLAHKILALGGRSAKYFIGPVKSQEHSKQRWYTVEVGID